VPAEVQLNVSPARAVYRPGQTIEVTAQVTDEKGSLVVQPNLEWSVSPPDAAQSLEQGRFSLVQEGEVLFKACALAPALEVCGEKKILIDGGAPLLEIASPQPGAEVGGDGEDTITIIGSVSDVRHVSVFVAGEAVELDELGAFEWSIPAVFGVNHIEVVASDGLTDDSMVQFDVLWAPAYAPATDSEGRPRFTATEALELRLAQSIVDDGRPRTQNPEGAASDLADVLELIMTHVDANQLFTNPLVNEPPTLSLSVQEVHVGQVETSLSIIDGGMELFIRLGTLEAATAGHLMVEGVEVDLTGELSAALSAFGTMTITKASTDAPVEVELAELVMAVESLEGLFTDPQASALFELADGLLRQRIEESLADALSTTVSDTTAAVLGDLLTSIDDLIAHNSFDIDTDVLPKMSVQLDGAITEMTLAANDSLTAVVEASVGTDQTAQYENARGVALVQPVVGEPFSAATDRPGQLAVRLDLVNGLLQSLWNSGLLEVDASSQIPDSLGALVSDPFVSGRLAPVVRPPRDNESYDLYVSVGQLELDAVVTGAPAKFGLNLEAGISVSLEDNRLILDLEPSPQLTAWVIDTEADQLPIDGEALQNLIVQMAWPRVLEALEEDLDLTLPVPSLADLERIAPALGGLQIGYQLRENPQFREGYLLLELGFALTLP
jgi:hypothetical protein